MSEADDFASIRDARDWEAQERALRAELRGAEPSAADARVDEYRLLVRALRNPPLDPVPPDFAARTAARVQGAGAADDRFEAWLQNGLLALLAVVGVWSMAAVGGQWLRAAAAALPEAAAGPIVNWGGAVLACIVLSAALEHWERRRRRVRR